MILEILFSVLIISMSYLFWDRTNQWISVSKSISGSSANVRIRVKKDLESIEFKDSASGKKTKDPFEFIRKNVKKGEILEFSYPSSKKSIHVIAVKDGQNKVYEASL